MKSGHYPALWVILPLFFLTGCVKDDVCYRTRDDTVLGLKFHYADPTDTGRYPTNDNEELLAVFVFDGQGFFMSRINDSPDRIHDDYIMELPYKQGSYQFVVWSGYNKNIYQLTECIPGKSHVNDFFLSVKREKGNRVTNRCSLLYHGRHDVVTVNHGEKKTVTINLKQITNRIRIVAYNLAQDGADNIYIEDTNGKYNSFSLLADDDKITYIPNYVSRSDPTVADFNVMKLEKGGKARLRIIDKDEVVRYDENLIDKLLGVNPNTNFDRDHDFLIEISFNHYIPSSIKINGWEIVTEEIQ